MKVYSFSKVIYDGYLSMDLFLFMIRQKFSRIFKFMGLIPSMFAFFIKHITMSELMERFYKVVSDNITVSELNMFKVNSMHKVDLVGFGITPDDKDCLIITGEPSFLIDLFIDRSHYTVICSEYNLQTSRFDGKVNLEKYKGDNLRAMGIARISQLFVHSLKDQSLLKMSDYIFIYRGSTIIDYSTYKPKLRDRIDYGIMNKSALIFTILSLVTMLFMVLVASIVSIFVDPVLTYVVAYLIWSIVIYSIASSFNKETPQKGNSIITFYVALVPNFLAILVLILIFKVGIGIASGVVFLLAGLVAFPLLAFIIRFYQIK
ncbi:MAG: hypothetical protein RR543_02500 [Erysipelotrichales bacterium]